MRARDANALRIASRIDASGHLINALTLKKKKRKRKKFLHAFFESCPRSPARCETNFHQVHSVLANQRAYADKSVEVPSVLTIRLRANLTRDRFVHKKSIVAASSSSFNILFHHLHHASLNIPAVSSYTLQLRADEKLFVPFFGFTAIRIIFVINVPLCAIVPRPIKDGRR